MTFDPRIHHRRSLRLKEYDYSQAGAYFVTICTKERDCLFGPVVEGEMQTNAAGEMIRRVWDELPVQYPGVEIDEFIVMPNHVHGVVVLTGKNLGQAQGPAPTRTLADVIHRFKSFTTCCYSLGVKEDGWRPYAGQLWQRNYYEHVVRGDKELEQIREYIANNPLQWMMDEYYRELL